MFYCNYRKDVKKTVEKFHKCDAQVIQNTRFAKNLRKRLRKVKKRATLIWTTLVVNGSIFMMIPYVTPGRHFSLDLYYLYGKRKKPMRM